ncbi:MAG: LysR family transcriptional regulator [Xanthobacteraceae bacterium]|jgi:DNA-binding transcriptional LysR family regulator
MDERALRRVKLSDLRLLRAVVDAGGMAKAGSQFNISQSAVSKAIATLEQTLGVRLLDRTPKGIVPTPYGEVLLKGAIGVFDELRQSINQIEFLSDPNIGELRFAASEHLLDSYVPAVIARLHRSYPRMRLRLVQVNTLQHEHHELRERNIELVIDRIIQAGPETDMNAEILFDDPVYVVAGVNSPWARRRQATLPDLMDALWALPPPYIIIGSQLVEAFQKHRLPLPQHVTCHSLQVQKALLTTGRYLAMLPNCMLQLGSERRSFKKLIRLSTQPAPVGIITLKKRTPHPLAKPFIQAAREIAKSLKPD